MALEGYKVGTKVWIRDGVDAWHKAEVVRVDDGGASLTAKTEAGKEVKAKPEELHLQNEDRSARGLDDMTKLVHMHEPGVLWNLKCRYQVTEIYTFTGTILIAVNPFQSLQEMYGSRIMEMYRGMDIGDLSPHVYAIADAAYRQMRKEWKGQSILVSGESGAGKTETSKLIMQYLAYMGGYSDSGEASGSGRSVEEQVLESNPLLEAFGNAKTSRNENSSRFGKYVEINFNKKGVISGAAIRTYLLERSRVVSINNPERNYHIFYQLCDGATPEERARWKLTRAADYHYLNQSSCFELTGVNNQDEYKRTCVAISRVGIPADDREGMFRTVAAILHLGNATFAPGPDDGSKLADARAEQHLHNAAELLGVDAAGLVKALTTRTRHTPDGAIVSPLDPKAATENRDSLAKVIYAKMFDWLVARINAAIGEDKNCAASVGVLDIYGFESFETNDFEQFCINLANEKLQQHFNQHVFKIEQEEYEREQIDWSYIEFVDNQDVLDLIEGKIGILDLLDEMCRFPTSTAADLAQKLYLSNTCKDSRRFSKPKKSITAFTIDHYAGGVTYETANFLDKNKDFVVPEHQMLLGASSSQYIAQLFYEEPEPVDPNASKLRAVKGMKFNSVGSQFKRQLAELMAALRVMEPHYIRCIKPNSFNKPGQFEDGNVLQQLRCGGVLEAVRISCAGFPGKTPYPDFVDHFWPLAPELLRVENLDDKDISQAIVRKAALEDKSYQFGISKVFLRSHAMAQLDQKRTDVLYRGAVTVQKYVRGWLQRRQFLQIKSSAIMLQALLRGLFARRVAQSLREQKAALLIQTQFRGFTARRDYNEARYLIERVQTIWRSKTAMDSLFRLRRLDAATTIQASWRAFTARRELKCQQQAAITLQNAYRCKLAVAELRQLRAEARESGKLLADKKALEIKVTELQTTLEVVQNQRNELRQQLKDEKVSMSEMERKLRDALEERERLAAEAASAVAAGELQQERDAKLALQQELEVVKAQLESAADAAAKKQAETDKKLKQAQEYIERQLNERKDFETKFRAMKDDLITRLQNACSQRDEARGHVLELQNELEKLREALLAKEAALGAAAASIPSTPMANGGATPMQQITPLANMQRAYATGGMKSMLTNITNTMALAPGTPGSAQRISDETGRAPLTPGVVGTPVAGTPSAAESEVERKARELQAKQAAMLAERRKAEEERLLSALQQPLGFHKGRPVAALVIFRCCLHWRAFQADRTSLFDRIIGVIGSQIEKQQEDNACLAYWLTNTVTLLHLLHRNIKPAVNSGNKARPMASAARNMFGSIFSSRTGSSSLAHAEASIHGGGVGGFKHVEAKYPALLFKQQLDAFVQKIFPRIRDNVKTQITPLVNYCIHSPKGQASMKRGAAHGDAGNLARNSMAAHSQGARSWSDILALFDQLLEVLKDNSVPKVLVQALFKQLFSFVNVQLFNQLLLRRECCNFSNGEYVKTGLLQVEGWIQQAGSDYVGDSWEELKYIRQAVTFLVIGNKPKKSLEEITSDLCPVLSIQQLYRISTMYWDDMYKTESVSPAVLNEMKKRMVDGSASSTHSFLLDDDSTLPFAPPEVLTDDKDLFLGVPVPEALKEAAPPAALPAPDGSATPPPPGTGQSNIGFTFLEKELRLAAGPQAGPA